MNTKVNLTYEKKIFSSNKIESKTKIKNNNKFNHNPIKQLNNIRKIAILIITLGEKIASLIFKFLNEESIQKISKEIMTIKYINSNEKQIVLEEFYNTIKKNNNNSTKFLGEKIAKKILEKSLEKEKASYLINKLNKQTKKFKKKPFDFLNKAKLDDLILLLEKENPQTLALVLSHLDFNLSSKIITKFNRNLQSDIAKRIATMSTSSKKSIEKSEKVLQSKLNKLILKRNYHIQGIEKVAAILNYLNPESERQIINSIKNDNSILARQIQDKMFVFQDITLLTDKEIRLILNKITVEKIALALKGQKKELIDKFFQNLSINRQKELSEEIEFLGPVKSKSIHEAQQNILNQIRLMENDNQIILKNKYTKMVL